MNVFEIINMAASTLAINKLRSVLTIVGIVIGNASVITIVGVGEGTQKLAIDKIKNLGPNVLFILPGSPQAQNIRNGGIPPTLVLSDAIAISSQVPSVVEVAPVTQSSSVVSHQNITTTSIIQGVTKDFPNVRNFFIDKGRFISDTDVKNDRQFAVIGTDIAQKLFGNRNVIGKKIRINNLSFDIIGLMESKGSSFGINQDDVIFIPITTMSKRVMGRNSPFGIRLSSIVVSARNIESMDAAEFQITNLLRQIHKNGEKNDFTVQNQKDALQTVVVITNALTLLLSAITSISLLVSGIGVMNIMLISVTERIQEIGLRKAIGATQTDILLQFTIEAVILTTVGGIIGTSIGFGSLIFIRNVTPLKTSISPSTIILAISVSGMIGLFFGIAPARQAASLDPIEALRSL